MFGEYHDSDTPIARVVPSVVALIGYVTLGVVSNLLATALHIPVFSSPELLIALPVPLVVAFGPRVLWGVGAGVVAVDAIAGAVGIATGVGLLAHGYAGYVAHRLVARRDGTDVSPRTLVTTTLVAVAGAAAIVAWGREVTLAAPFYLSAVVLTAEFLLVAGLSVVPLTRLAVAVRERVLPDGVVSGRRSESPVSGPKVAAVTGIWLVGGIAGSLGYRTFVRLPEPAFARRNLEVLLTLDRPDLFGVGGGRLLVFFGVVMLVVLALLTRGRDTASISRGG